MDQLHERLERPEPQPQMVAQQFQRWHGLAWALVAVLWLCNALAGQAVAQVLAEGEAPEAELVLREPIFFSLPHYDYTGKAVTLPVGDYTHAALTANSIDNFQEAETTVNPVGPNKLYLADFDNDRIGIMRLSTWEILTSYPAPTREKGQDAFPIALALLRGRLYVNNFNFTSQCTDDDLFAINPQVGVVFGRAHTPGCNPIDGMAAIPEAGLLVGMEITIGEGPTTERLHLFRPRLAQTQQACYEGQ
jgi:hypothetical protein